MSSPFLVRLRGTESGIVDLAGNTWTNNGVTVGNTGFFNNGRALVFDSTKTNHLLVTKSIELQQDFTIAYWIKLLSSTYGTTIAQNGSAGPNVFSSISATTNIQPGIKPINNIGYYFTSDIAKSDACHVAVVRKSGVLKIFVNGELGKSVNETNNVAFSQIRIGGNGYESDSSVGLCGQVDDICILNIAVWDSDFTPPTDYLMLNGVVYLSGQEAWGIDGMGAFAKLSNNYNAMTDAQKIAMFQATDHQIPTIAQLKTLAMPIKVVNYQDDNSQPACTVKALPQPQTITPKGRIPLLKYNKIRQVTITGANTGDGAVKIAVTKDNSTYQVYDTVNQEWKTIDIADIGTDGMSLTDVSALTVNEWIAYDCMNTGIGFAYYLEMASTSDTAYTDELSLNVELMEELVSIIKGIDFDYSYPSNSVLQVKLYKNGNFRINYNPGPPSTALKIPTVSEPLTYTGEEQSIPIVNYDPAKMTMSGTTAATNVGVYTVAVTPNIGYEWEDLTTGAKTLTWSIV